MKTAEEILKKYPPIEHNQYDILDVIEAMEAYHAQFTTVSEASSLTDEEIWKIRIDAPYSPYGFVIYKGTGDKNKTICRLPFGAMIPLPQSQKEACKENENNAKLIVDAVNIYRTQLTVTPDKEVSRPMIDVNEYLNAKFPDYKTMEWSKNELAWLLVEFQNGIVTTKAQ